MCINNELAVIEKALKENGFEIVVENEHPSEYSEKQILEHIKRLTKERNGVFAKVKIVMKHLPWGG